MKTMKLPLRMGIHRGLAKAWSDFPKQLSSRAIEFSCLTTNEFLDP